MTLKHLRSSTADKRPQASGMADGQLAINTASGSPGLFFKDTNGSIVKIGPVHVGSGAPNVSPASGGTTGNSLGEQWLDTSNGNYVFKIWDGGAWRSETGEFVNASGDTMTGSLVLGSGASLVFEGSTDDGFETTLTVVDPTADRTITLPNVNGTVVTTGDTGTVTSTMLLDGTIVNADVNVSAAIAGTKISPDFGGQTITTSGIVSVASGSAAAPSIAINGDANTGIYSPGADQVAISTNGTERARIDSSGRLLVGTSTSTENVRVGQKFACVTTGGSDNGGISLTTYGGTNSNIAPVFDFQRSRGTTDGSLTEVISGDRLGYIVFRGADGATFSDGAVIIGEADGDWTTSGDTTDSPGRLVFSTTADGASSPTERMRITSDAYVRLASSTGGIQFNGDTAAANALDDYEEGSWTPVIVGTTAAGTGTYSRQVGRYTKIGSRVVAEGICTWSAHTGTGNIKMTGLPFTLSNAANYLTAVALHVNNITSPAGTIVQAYSPGNLTEIVFTSVATGGGAFASLAMDTAGEFIVSISYTVA